MSVPRMSDVHDMLDRIPSADVLRREQDEELAKMKAEKDAAKPSEYDQDASEREIAKIERAARRRIEEIRAATFVRLSVPEHAELLRLADLGRRAEERRAKCAATMAANDTRRGRPKRGAA